MISERENFLYQDNFLKKSKFDHFYQKMECYSVVESKGLSGRKG